MPLAHARIKDVVLQAAKADELEQIAGEGRCCMCRACSFNAAMAEAELKRRVQRPRGRAEIRAA